MTKRGHLIGTLVVLMILELTVQSITNPWQKSTLTSKIFSERMINTGITHGGAQNSDSTNQKGKFPSALFFVEQQIFNLV